MANKPKVRLKDIAQRMDTIKSNPVKPIPKKIKPMPKKIGGGPTKKQTLPKKITGADAIKRYQQEISPKGMAAAEAAAKKAIEDKYPGMFIPSTRKTAGVKRGK